MPHDLQNAMHLCLVQRVSMITVYAYRINPLLNAERVVQF